MKLNSFLILLIIFSITNVKAQDSLTIEQLNHLSYTFHIDQKNQLQGKGAQFLRNEISKAQYTMLGEYHNSKRISEFTQAIIPILDSVGYKTMVLEVGPISGKWLNSLDTNIKEQLKTINTKYLTKTTNRTFTPIPFFSHVEDADFLDAAKKNDWTIIGIDQEFMYGYKILTDRMYDNLDSSQKALHRKLYLQVTDSLDVYYKNEINGSKKLAIAISNSNIMEEYFSKMAVEPKNIEIIEALKNSVYIYKLHADKQWFENNATRVRYMKQMLSTQLAKNKFDLKKDKLFIKMGGLHLSKGFSPLRLFEVGNTLNELAEYHSNSALNITFSSRFYMDNGKLIDILDSDNEYLQRLKDFNQIGQKDEWIIIDLRPLIKGHYYNPVKYKFNKHIEDLVKRYDLLIIPKTEIDATPNYSE